MKAKDVTSDTNGPGPKGRTAKTPGPEWAAKDVPPSPEKSKGGCYQGRLARKPETIRCGGCLKTGGVLPEL